jgi:uncharacterized protein YcfL
VHNIAHQLLGERHKMKPKNYLFIVLASFILIACSPEKDTQTKLFEEQRNALDKAKAVESVVRQQTEEMQKNMEKQTQ